MEVNDQVIEQPPEEKEVSLADTIRASIAEVKAGKGDPATADTAQPAEVEATGADRARDGQGRFAKGEKITAENMKAPKTDAEGAVPAPSAPAAAASKAPERWPEGAKAKFAALDPEVQAAINLREQTMHKEITRQDEERLFGKKVREVAQPYLATIQAEGGTVEAAFQQFLNTAHILRGNNPDLKKQALLSIAQKFSVELGNPLQPGAAPPAPAIAPQQVTQLVQAELSSWQKRQEQAQVSSEIDKFAADPANVHYETVKPVMASLLQTGQAENLKQAYDLAIWTNPEIRSTLLAQQQSDADQKRLADAKAKADAAKRAGGSLTGGPGSATALAGAGADVPLRETIRASLREAQGRV